MSDTIFALSSGGLPSGVAVIRISGPKSRVAVETMCVGFEFGKPRGYSKIIDPGSGYEIDHGLVLSFIAPASFTGEDVVEFQFHGGRAVVQKILASLATIDGLRHADAGEFTYRAFENGKLDLTQAEGIADLINSDTETQRLLALDSAVGKAKRVVENWSKRLTTIRALIEAEIDFIEEDDISPDVSDQVWFDVEKLVNELDRYLFNSHAGEIIRDGYRVTLLGKPNAGKSTLLNCLAGREVAIVTDEPGTTRDVLEVRLNLGGQVIILSDTAGIHDTSNITEKEGIKRAKDLAARSDMNIWLHGADDKEVDYLPGQSCDLKVFSKSDKSLPDALVARQSFDVCISVFDNSGIDQLIESIGLAAKNAISCSGEILFSKQRQRSELTSARDALRTAAGYTAKPLEVRAESLRVAADSFGRIVGRVDVEELLGTIFSQFCVGK